MNRKWFYFRDGKGYGPYEAKKISTWVESGKLDASTKVWADGLPEPKPLSEVAAFEDIQSSSKVPPPLPEMSPPSPDESEPDAPEPPPLPPKKETSNAKEESPASTKGAIQTEQDQNTANWMRRASMTTLAIIFISSVITLVSRSYQSGETSSASYGQSAKVDQQKWPSVFDAENRDYLTNPSPPSLSEELARDIGKTFGFRYGQNYSLDRIRREYAGERIGVKARLSKLRFTSRFGATYDYIDSLFSAKSQEGWTQAKQRIKDQSTSLLQSGTISRAKASAFVDTVRKRSEGRLPSSILETLLMFDPEYIKRPEEVFNDGFTKEYRSGGHPKSEGIDLGIQYPASWKAEEGRRPHIVQKFTSENGRGLTTAMILVREFPEDLSSEATEADFEKAILDLDREKMFGSVLPRAEVLETGNVRLAGEPAIWGRYEALVNRAGMEVDFHGLTFMMPRNGNMVQVIFMVGEPSRNESRKARGTFEHYGALFQRMTNSIDFFGRYE